MTPNEFAYWLQGFAELNAEPPTAEQWQAIKEHLQLVFKKVTPPVNLGGLQGYPFINPNGAGQIVPNVVRSTC